MGQFFQGVRTTVVRTVPAGGVLADQGIVIGNEFLIAESAGAEGDEVVFVRVGGHSNLAKKAGDTFAAGALVYFNNTTKVAEATATSTNYLIGIADAVAASGDEGVDINLPGMPVYAGSVAADITSVLAGTAMTGGGSAGAVTLNVDLGTGAAQAAAGNHTHAAPTAAGVSFDNTTAQLPNNPDTVQEGLDELITLFMGTDAGEVPYDHTDSGLAAEDVQAAIDELADEKAAEAYTNVALEGVTTLAGALDAIVTRLVALEGA